MGKDKARQKLTQHKRKVLVVDDEADIRQLIGQILEDFDYEVTEVHDADAARNAVRLERFDAILLDIWMPGDDGITLLQEWYRDKMQSPVIMLSAHGTVDTAVAATKFGAYDYLEKPVSAGRLEITVRNAVNLNSKEFADDQEQRIPKVKPELIGSSSKLVNLRTQISDAANTNANILVVGEPGSGRETVARAIHEEYCHDQQPLVVVDWLASEDLGQSVTQLIEQAVEGTLLIQELHAYDCFNQNRLLGLVQKLSELTRAEDDASPPRLIATATNAISTCLQVGEFRPELYFRLSQLTINVPPLREHVEDVPELVGYFTDYLSQTENLKYRCYSTAALNQLRNHAWYGNIDELVNVVRRIMLSDSAEMISGPDVQPFLTEIDFPEAPVPSSVQSPASNFALPYKAAREKFERDYLLYHLRNSSTYVEIAQKTKLHRSSLFRKIKELGIEILPGGEFIASTKRNLEK